MDLANLLNHTCKHQNCAAAFLMPFKKLPMPQLYIDLQFDLPTLLRAPAKLYGYLAFITLPFQKFAKFRSKVTQICLWLFC